MSATHPAHPAASSGTTAPPRQATLLLDRRPFTVEDYHRMADIGIFGPDERTELLDGEVVRRMTVSSRHAGCVKQLLQIFAAGLAGRAILGVQDPVQLDDRSEPEPDLAILAMREDMYRQRHPLPADIHLLIEVAESSIQIDREIKTPLYAAAGIPELWIVDLPAERISVLRQPGPAGFDERIELGRGDRLTPMAFPELEIRVEEVLGPAAG